MVGVSMRAHRIVVPMVVALAAAGMLTLPPASASGLHSVLAAARASAPTAQDKRLGPVRDLKITVKGNKATATWKLPKSTKGIIKTSVYFDGWNDYTSRMFGQQTLKPTATSASGTIPDLGQWCKIVVTVTPISAKVPGNAAEATATVPCSPTPPAPDPNCSGEDSSSDPNCGLGPGIPINGE